MILINLTIKNEPTETYSIVPKGGCLFQRFFMDRSRGLGKSAAKLKQNLCSSSTPTAAADAVEIAATKIILAAAGVYERQAKIYSGYSLPHTFS